MVMFHPSPNERTGLPFFIRQRNVSNVSGEVDPLMEHLNDPNYDLQSRCGSSHSSSSSDSLKFENTVDRLSSPQDITAKSHKESVELSSSTATDFDDESPYPEVRAAVSSIDDPTMPVNTFRMWFLGLLFTFVISGLNQFFSMRSPSIYITSIVVQLVALPFGKALEKILPTTRFKTFGRTWSLNPGPFNIKEHVCIAVMTSVGGEDPYALRVIAAQKNFYQQNVTFIYQILLVISTQVLGFSLGGLLRQFVVWPASMVWPAALVSSALFNTLHKNFGKRDRGHMTRDRFFCIAMACSFIWYWFPGYLFTALSIFNWVCWIAPNNVTVNALFGSQTGLGMGILTFDWSVISFSNGSPLVTPWWSQLNTGISLVICYWIIVPIIYFTNTFFTAYLPIATYRTFDNTGMPYKPTAIITNGTFDVEKYRGYSPLYMSAALCMTYGVSFASSIAVFVHAFLWYRRDIIRRFRSTLKDEPDIHSRLMRSYAEVPAWWYGAMGAMSFVLLIIAIKIFPTQLPIWAAFLAFFLALILCIPLSILQASANQQVPIQVMHELLAGYMLPGRPVANALFKTIAYIATNRAMQFAGDLKLGHYMKIPPRTMFTIQVVAAVVSCFMTTSVQEWMFSNIVDLCTRTQKDRFTCPHSNTLAAASLIWGGIGPQRMFDTGKMYNSLTVFFAVGALAPIPFYFLARRYPLSFWRYINIPIFFGSVGWVAIASGVTISSWITVGLIFNYYIRRFHFRWWMRYNYILSAALESGVALGMILIFFTVQYPKGGFNIEWWGNTVWKNTADGQDTPLYAVNPGETFGPTKWS